ncbi:hypothetical protein [Emticicia fontis]
MNQFRDFNIKVVTNTFVGDKIKIQRVLNRTIQVHAFKIEDSKLNTGKCLFMQIEINKEKHVIFTGSNSLIESIKQVPENGFPFETTIVQDNQTFQFT